MLQRLAHHVSNYSAGSLLVTLASLVSFPILTRLLGVDEYGVMSLIATLLSLGVGIAKLGVQHAALRFYSEIRAGRREATMPAYVSTMVFGMCGAGLAATLLWATASWLVPAAWWNDARLPPLMLLASGLVFIRVADSALVNQLRAQEQSRALNVYYVVRRYAGLALLLAVMFLVSRDLWGFYGATVAGEGLATLVLAVWMWRRLRPRPRDFSAPLFRAMLAFGLPMIGFELSSVILAMGDRYVIQRLLGAQPLGLYSAAYNLCDYVRAVCIGSFAAAVLPMYLRLWEEKGREETLAFLQRFLHVYAMASLLVIAGLSAVGGELLAVLASEKYRDGAALVPWVIGGMALDGLVMVAGAGLYIEKRSRTVMVLTLASAALNIGLNFLWLPRWGLVGAAAATLASYAALLLSALALGWRRLPVRPPLGALLKFGAIALAMHEAVTAVRLEGDLATLLARVALGLPIYAALALALDARARAMAASAWRRWQDRGRPQPPSRDPQVRTEHA